jgi:hypothetical protein
MEQILYTSIAASLAISSCALQFGLTRDGFMPLFWVIAVLEMYNHYRIFSTFHTMKFISPVCGPWGFSEISHCHNLSRQAIPLSNIHLPSHGD